MQIIAVSSFHISKLLGVSKRFSVCPCPGSGMMEKCFHFLFTKQNRKYPKNFCSHLVAFVSTCVVWFGGADAAINCMVKTLENIEKINKKNLNSFNLKQSCLCLYCVEILMTGEVIYN